MVWIIIIIIIIIITIIIINFTHLLIYIFEECGIIENLGWRDYPWKFFQY